MNPNPQPPSATPNARSWLLLLVGAIFALLGAIELWTAFDSTWHSVPATAKVIATEGGIGRTHSVHAKVEVAAAGQIAVQTEVEDVLAIGSWTEGGTVDVVCTKLGTSSPHCDLDSALDRWLFPVLFSAPAAERSGWRCGGATPSILRRRMIL